MLHILQLFGRSPFAPLQGHMDKVQEAVHKLYQFFESFEKKDAKKQQKIADQISEIEHIADVAKNDIRNGLPSSLYIQIDRSLFLQMLSLQDSIADNAEDITVASMLRPLHYQKTIFEKYTIFLKKNIECFDAVHAIIKELHELLEASFGGVEAERVKGMCDTVFFLEHELDILQRSLLQSLFEAEPEMTYGAFFQWQKVFEATGAIANLSEKLANCVRMSLDIKK